MRSRTKIEHQQKQGRAWTGASYVLVHVMCAREPIIRFFYLTWYTFVFVYLYICFCVISYLFGPKKNTLQFYFL